MKHRIAVFLATTFYTGYCPAAPGTAGAVAGLIFIVIFPLFRGLLLLQASVILFFAGVWAAGETEKTHGHDAPQINIDEAAGIWITFIGFGASEFKWIWLVTGFVLFRVFDIAKPGFIGKAQRLRGGWGVMMDDVIAGLYANITLRAVIMITGYFS